MKTLWRQHGQSVAAWAVWAAWAVSGSTGSRAAWAAWAISGSMGSKGSNGGLEKRLLKPDPFFGLRFPSLKPFHPQT